MKKNVWKDGILGVVVGDALGCPVQFETREEVAKHPVEGMRGHGTFNLPAGSWTDDSSLTLALLDSIADEKGVDLREISDNFVAWLEHGEYTPHGYAFDIGGGCYRGIKTYSITGKTPSGDASVHNNGNGSLMRILPVCIYCATQMNDDKKAIAIIEDVSAITHAHKTAKIACGIYYFIVKNILKRKGLLSIAIQIGIDEAFAFYAGETKLAYYARLRDIPSFRAISEKDIRSTGYAVDTLEASVWCLVNTNSYKSALLKAVNLGYDTDTVGAVAGGLAGLYYGADSIPSDWLKEIKRLDWIEELYDKAEKAFSSSEIVIPAGTTLTVDSVTEKNGRKVINLSVEKQNRS